MQIIHSEICPGGGSGDESYALPADVESVFVLDGILEIDVDGDVYLLDRGDALTFTPSLRHSFVNPAPDTMTRVLWILTPGLNTFDDRRDATS